MNKPKQGVEYTPPMTPKKAKSGLVRKSVSSLKPAPENDEVYRAIRADDPAIIELSAAIKRYGLLQPIVVTKDGYVLSGHRRLAALKLIGQKTVRCCVAAVSREKEPEKFLRLLTEHNRQREKSQEEKLRETIVSLDAGECHRRLRDRRQSASIVDVAALQLADGRARAEISDAKIPMLDAIKRVLDERRAFLPTTVRAIHYALLNDPPLRHSGKPESRYLNNKQSYRNLVDLLARARLYGLVPMGAISDDTRPVTIWDVSTGAAQFVAKELKEMFRGYYRDLMLSQPNHIEVVCEKNTVDAILQRVTSDYGIPQTSGRGYASLPPRAAMAKRYGDSGKEKLVLLLVSDFDPDGEEICHSFARSMRDDFGIDTVHPIKVALTQEQVLSRKLPPSMDAKVSSANFAKFAAKYGTDAYELEALRPEDLQQLLRDAINQVIDTVAYDREVESEKEDARFLEGIRETVIKCLKQAQVFADEEGMQ